MLRFVTCILLYCSLSNGQTLPPPLPFGVTPAVPYAGIPPVTSSVFPFGRTPGPVVPGYNNPYYNPAAGPAVPILSYTNDHGADGTYSYSFSTADGKQVQESGYLKDAFIDNAGEPQGTQVVQGSYAYVAPDGTPIQVSYIADENGFRPSGVHIPADGKGVVPPAILDKDNKPIFDRAFNNPAYNNPAFNNPAFNNPAYNTPYSPLTRFNGRYNNNYFGSYKNRLSRPYDPRYPYDPAVYSPYNNLNNPYRPSWLNNNNQAKKEEPKKDS